MKFPAARFIFFKNGCNSLGGQPCQYAEIADTVPALSHSGGFFYGGAMEVIINGKNLSADFKDVNDLLAREDLDPKLVVVELNGKVLPKEDYGVPLKDGDAVEIVQFVAGG